MIDVAIVCENCEQEIETSATFEALTNSIQYTCTECGEAGSESNWEEGAN